MSLLAVDPGVQAHACANFEGKKLAGLWFVADMAQRYPSEQIVIEKPVIRPGHKIDNNDLIDLAWSAGVFIGAQRCGHVTKCKPEDWKGQVCKPLNHARILAALSADELQVVAAACGRDLQDIVGYTAAAVTRWSKTKKVTRYSRKDHNLLDAVGIGLWHLGRTRKGGLLC